MAFITEHVHTFTYLHIIITSVDTAVAGAIQYATKLLGVKYAPWTGRVIGSGPPFWVNDKPPSIKEVEGAGANCIGFINLISTALNDRAHSDWFAHLETKGVLEPYVHNKVYPPGTMVLRRYKDVEDQGHVGMIVSDTELVHSYMYVEPHQSFQDSIHAIDATYAPGVTIEMIDVSHSWFKEGTYTHACKPGA
jgi:hypothetical protein